MSDFTSFVTAMIALSVGVERIVEILKGMIGWLDGHANVVRFLAFIVGTGVALVLGPKTLLSFLPVDGTGSWAGAALLGMMASGGSAFWNHILDILGAVKSVREAEAKVEAPPTNHLIPNE